MYRIYSGNRHFTIDLGTRIPLCKNNKLANISPSSKPTRKQVAKNQWSMCIMILQVYRKKINSNTGANLQRPVDWPPTAWQLSSATPFTGHHKILGGGNPFWKTGVMRITGTLSIQIPTWSGRMGPIQEHKSYQELWHTTDEQLLRPGSGKLNSPWWSQTFWSSKVCQNSLTFQKT